MRQCDLIFPKVGDGETLFFPYTNPVGKLSALWLQENCGIEVFRYLSNDFSL